MKRTYDYRLRGLDLGAQLIDDAQRAGKVKRAKNRRARRRLMIQLTLVIVAAAAVMMLLRSYVIEPVTVNSNAMVPTLPSGSSVLVVKWDLLTGSPKTGDVLVFHEPATARCQSEGSTRHDLIARVIGRPGETIWSSDGRVYINGKLLDERGWYNTPFGEVGRRAIPRTTIPSGSYYVMGDNRTDTCDSRAFGPVAEFSVIGKVVATVLRDGHPFVRAL